MIKKISYTLIPACMALSVAMAGPLSPSLMSLSLDQMDQATAGLRDNVVAGVTGGGNSGLSGVAAVSSGQTQAAAVRPEAVTATIAAPTADISSPDVYSQQHNAYLVTMISTGLSVNVAARAIVGSDFLALTRGNVEPMMQATGGGSSGLSDGVAIASGQTQAASVRPGTVTATIVVPTADASGQLQAEVVRPGTVTAMIVAPTADASGQLQAVVVSPETVTATIVAPSVDISGPNVYLQQYITNMIGRLGQINEGPVIAASVPTVHPF